MRGPTASCGRGVAVALVLLGLHTTISNGSRSPAEDAILTAASPPPEVCEFRTINYITHTLPQQCLRTSWTAAPTTAAGTVATAEPTPTAATTTSGGPEPTAVNETQQENKQPGEKDTEREKDKDKEDPENEGFAAGSFMSFEEWKEMMLRKSGQDPAKLKDKKPHEHKGERDSAAGNNEPESVGEDGEIDFDALSEKVSELASSASGEPTPRATAQVPEPVVHEDGVTQYYRSKDAGKTCKERFSYSSFDAGATILKTSPGAKNPKAILVENKDTYMLMECRTKNKFVIVELSDDILVDTIVLANFEFFSSMIRQFRVSVSDRYPVKMDKWVDLGTFEARNTRDIQAFLVEHPQIYTKYVRIEFLSHFGNEYYCPVSLLRVHGTRMLDTWKEQDNSRDDEVEQIEGPQEPAKESNQTEPQAVDAPPNATEVVYTSSVIEMGLSPWQPMFYYNFSEETCASRSPTTGEPTPVSEGAAHNHSASAGHGEDATVPSPQATPESNGQSVTSPSTGASSAQPAAAQSQQNNNPSSPPSSQHQNTANTNSNNTTNANHSAKQPLTRGDSATDKPPPRAGTTTPSFTSSRNKTATSAPPSSPTVQESFFKTVNKRLQLLESNTSLSLQYIEEQSRFLQDALLKMEKKQASRVDAFLDSLNKTVLSDLRILRTQYDQLWQSTVLAIESQREQSQRETVALSERLAVLADEVVFQKRMAIAQSILLLCCLVLVIFTSNGGGNVRGGFDSFSHHFRQDSIMSASSPPPSSPPPQGGATPRVGTSYRADKILPMTPTSQTSREGTPLIHVDHVDGAEGAYYGEASPSPPPPQQLKQRRSRVVPGTAGEDIEEEDETAAMESTAVPVPATDDRGQESEERIEAHADQEPALRPLVKARSNSSQLGSARKPLPALPEDPS